MEATGHTAAELGFRLIDERSGRWTSMTIPPAYVVTGRWVQGVVKVFRGIIDATPHIEVSDDGLRVAFGYCKLPNRRALLGTPLPMLPTSLGRLAAPRVLYVSKQANVGMFCADQPVTAKLLRDLQLEAPGGPLSNTIDFDVDAGHFTWSATDHLSQRLTHAELTELQSPYLAGTCSVTAKTITTDTQGHAAQMLELTVEGPVGHPFSIQDARQSFATAEVEQVSDHAIRMKTFCHADRHGVWELAERLGWSQRLYPVAPFEWRDQPGSRIVIDEPRRGHDWPLS